MLLLPRQDNAALRDAEAERRQSGQPRTFAVDLPVHVSPATHGEWHTDAAGHAVWQMRIRSEGAESLNLGFSEYQLPPGAELYLSNEQDRYGPFTAADNKPHAEFWSPLLTGDELLVELVLPDQDRSAAKLLITTVNHDFEGVGDLLSGDCNLDVACGAAEGFPQIDNYRDVIRSVAAYTLNGRDQCTGFLVNNVNQDGRPLFLTAEHCRVTEGNAASIVIYWNYQNSACRLPGSPESGLSGDGSRQVFNSGARVLAYSPTSDFMLLELDAPVNPLANAYFAGWSAEASLPKKGVATVHHPGVGEKRISFSDRPITPSDAFGNEIFGETNYLQVPSWDIGTTEGGSSGAPLFDHDGLVRGHLFGGAASCTNDGSDIFGFVHRDWTGDGTPQTRLKDWLDPCGTGRLKYRGLDQSELARLVTAREHCQSSCVGDSTVFTIDVGADFPPGSLISVDAPPGLNVTVPRETRGGTSFSIVLLSPTATAGEYPINVTVDGFTVSDVLPINLTLSNGPPKATFARQPADGATAVDPFPTFRWQAVPGAIGYELQLSLREDFSTLAASYRELTADSLSLAYPLMGATTYYWRVRAVNECGGGVWSVPLALTTDNTNCSLRQSAGLPVAISTFDVTQVAATIEITEPLIISSLEVSLGVEHTFLGDINATLISPGGTAVPLFDYPLAGTCPATDLYATFSDAADLGLANRCESGNVNIFQFVRPAQALETLRGESAQGTWQVVINDQAALDGGQITTFNLRICDDDVSTSDYTVNLNSADIVTCSNTAASAELVLGADYGREVALRIEAGQRELDNYTYIYDVVSRRMIIDFSTFDQIGAGTFPLTYIAIAADGSEHRAVGTLSVRPVPEAVPPGTLSQDSTTVTFRWRSSAVAERYLVEVASDENFSSVVLSEPSIKNQLSILREALPDQFFWRIVTENSCGSLPGPPRAIKLSNTTAVHDFAAGGSISIYPNPTYGAVTVAFDRLDFRSFRAQLFSTTGQQLREWTALKGARQQLDLAALPAGVYYLRVSGPAGATTEKLSLLR